MPRLPNLPLRLLTPNQRAHRAEVERIAAEGRQARAEAALVRQRDRAVVFEREAEREAWAETVVESFARAEAEGRARALRSVSASPPAADDPSA
jgi:hypothetical protein